MATTITKTYHFNVTKDTDGWVATKGHANIQAAHRGRQWNNHALADPVKSIRGAIRMTVPQDTPTTENYWELTKTWEQLGVPSGKIVTTVNLSYLYRWYAKRQRNINSGPVSSTQFTNVQCGSGPATFRNSGGTLLDTFSSRVYAIARTALNLWGYYPAGPVPGSHINPSLMPGWGVSSGSPISISSTYQPAATTVKFRIGNLLPAAALAVSDPTWIRYQTDGITIEMTYEDVGGVVTAPLILFSD